MEKILLTVDNMMEVYNYLVKKNNAWQLSHLSANIDNNINFLIINDNGYLVASGQDDIIYFNGGLPYHLEGVQEILRTVEGGKKPEQNKIKKKKTVDEILDKISNEGITSLNEEEIKILKQQQ